MQTDILREKIRNLPPEKIIEAEDFVDFLSMRSARRLRQERHNAIAAYAAQYASTEADLDSDLEQTAVEHLLEMGNEKARGNLYRRSRAAFRIGAARATPGGGYCARCIQSNAWMAFDYCVSSLNLYCASRTRYNLVIIVKENYRYAKDYRNHSAG